MKPENPVESNHGVIGPARIFIPGMREGVSVVSSSGGAPTSIEGSTLIIGLGLAFDVRLSDETFYSLQEGIGSTFHDSSGKGDDGTGVESDRAHSHKIIRS